MFEYFFLLKTECKNIDNLFYDKFKPKTAIRTGHNLTVIERLAFTRYAFIAL